MVIMNLQTSFMTGEEEVRWHGSMANLSQIRASQVSGIIPRRTFLRLSEQESRVDKTIVCEDREQRLALLDKDTENDQDDTASINTGSFCDSIEQQQKQAGSQLKVVNLPNTLSPIASYEVIEEQQDQSVGMKSPEERCSSTKPTTTITLSSDNKSKTITPFSGRTTQNFQDVPIIKKNSGIDGRVTEQQRITMLESNLASSQAERGQTLVSDKEKRRQTMIFMYQRRGL